MRLIPKRDPTLGQFDISPDTWRTSHWDIVLSADYTCPHGHENFLKPGIHRVEEDGTVYPSVICMGGFGSCDFHEFVRLMGWEASP